MRLPHLVMLVLLLVHALSSGALAGYAGNAFPLLPISVQDGRFVDSKGNERHFRGVNVVYKDPPWYPAVATFQSNLSFTAEDADLLKSYGVNLIRLGVMWPGVVPQKNTVDAKYLAAIDRIVELAASRGIYSLLDPHQDEFNPRFCGEGVPNWWTIENTDVKDFPVPVQTTPFGASPPTRDQCFSHSSFSYIFTHDAGRAYQKLWRNPAAFADFWRIVAAHFRGNPAVLGAELWNEPFPGDVYGNASYRNNRIADRVNLQPFYETIEESIHSASGDPGLLIAYEPSWPVGDQDLHPKSILPAGSGFSKLPGKSPLYAFHYYTAPCDPNISAYLDARLADARRLNAMPIATEFNLGASNAEEGKRMMQTFEEFENRLISYTGWQYKSYSGSLPNGTCTGCGNSFFNEDGSLSTYMVRAIARPFAHIVGGNILSRSFDMESAQFEFSYELSSQPHAVTVVVLPGEWSGGSFGKSVSGQMKLIIQNMPGQNIAPNVEQLPYHILEIHPTSLSFNTGKIVVKLWPENALIL